MTSELALARSLPRLMCAASAFKDHRFNPIAERELASLECG
jgi:AMMECR1 domain-containing protein